MTSRRVALLASTAVIDVLLRDPLRVAGLLIGLAAGLALCWVLVQAQSDPPKNASAELPLRTKRDSLLASSWPGNGAWAIECACGASSIAHGGSWSRLDRRSAQTSARAAQNHQL